MREQAIVILGFLASTASQINNVAAAIANNYGRADESERLRMLDVMSNLPAAESAQWVASIWRTAASAAERSAAADAVLKLAPRMTMDAAIVRAAKDLRAKGATTHAAPE